MKQLHYKKKYDKYKKKYINLCNQYGGLLVSSSRMMNITKDFNLYDVESFNQYIVTIDETPGQPNNNKFRLVTIIGETHIGTHTPIVNVTTTSFPFITVADYIKMILKNKNQDSQTFILLEYNTGTNLSANTNLNSINIKDVVQVANKDRFSNLLFGIDIRETFAGMSELYYTHENTPMSNILKYIDMLDIIIQKIYKLYIDHTDRYSVNWKNYLDANHNDIKNDKKILDNQKNVILGFIQNNNLPNDIGTKIFYDTLLAKGSNNEKDILFTPMNSIDILRRIYMKLTDLYAMTIVVRKDLQIDHLVILIGQQHAHNLYNVLHSFNRFSGKNLGGNINIKGSLYF